MKKFVSPFLLLLLAALPSLAQPLQPKLVVGIVVDQMRHEYLQRFKSKYASDGFNRILNEGFEARNNHFDYIPTYTAPGHASVYTGTTPRYHGIIGNDWYSKVLGRSVYCVGDTLANHIGGSAKAGNISPRNLITNTITDELKLSTNFRSKVVGISIKDRGAVLPAGHTPDGAYWYDSRTGEFMTSDFYKTEMPEWMVDFNQKKLVDQYLSQKWETLLPIKEYVESTPDNSPYERGFKGKETPTFPYDLSSLRTQNSPYGLINSTPFSNSLLVDLAKAAITGEDLGKDEITDFLAVSFSSPDYIGHNFGPNSVELEDTYLRLDRNLADLMSYLDEQIGKGNYLLFLTADHGVVANPQFLMDHQLPGGYINGDEAQAQIARALMSQYGKADFISNFSNDQIFLNHRAIKSAGFTVPEVARYLTESVMEIPAVADAVSAYEINSLDSSDPMSKLLRNGYNRKLSGDVLLLMKPGYLYDSYGNKGSSHGTGYTYDTHVPLLFYGSGIKRGFTVEKTCITDIAPTLAALLNISMPNAAVSGQPIKDLFD